MTPTLYAGAALGIALIGSLTYSYIAGVRLESCNTSRIAEKAMFHVKLAEYDQKLARQERAVSDLESASKARQVLSGEALAKARLEGKGIASELDRLRLEASRERKSSVCAAGEAISVVRQGFK